MKIVFGCVLLSSCASAFVFGPNRSQLKSDILELSEATRRGLDADDEDKERMDQLFRKLETMNPTRKPLKDSRVNGVWSLEYTTSDSILGKGDFPRVGPILQTIDTTSLSAENSEVVSYFGLKVPRKVTAELTPQNDQLTDVQFKQFSLGPISFDAPGEFFGQLDITYVDDDLRLTRGDKGNIFVLTRFAEI